MKNIKHLLFAFIFLASLPAFAQTDSIKAKFIWNVYGNVQAYKEIDPSDVSHYQDNEFTSEDIGSEVYRFGGISVGFEIQKGKNHYSEIELMPFFIHRQKLSEAFIFESSDKLVYYSTISSRLAYLHNWYLPVTKYFTPYLGLGLYSYFQQDRNSPFYKYENNKKIFDLGILIQPSCEFNITKLLSVEVQVPVHPFINQLQFIYIEDSSLTTAQQRDLSYNYYFFKDKFAFKLGISYKIE